MISGTLFSADRASNAPSDTQTSCPVFCYRKREHRHEYHVLSHKEGDWFQASTREHAHAFCSTFKQLGLKDAKVLHKVIYKLNPKQERSKLKPNQELENVTWDDRTKEAYYVKPVIE